MRLPPPWFDPQQQPQRQFVRNPGVVLQPVGNAAQSPETLLAAQWGALLGRGADDLLLCATEVEAAEAMVGALVHPGDTAILAAPASGAAIAALLRRGGRFVDVGRDHRGRIDPDALRLALRHHPGAWVWLQRGEVDDSAFASSVELDPQRLLYFADGAEVANEADAAPCQSALAGQICLRDPSAGTPLLWAVVTQGAAPALRRLLGLAGLSAEIHQRAQMRLAGMNAGALAGEQAGLARRAAALAEAVAHWPGAVLWEGSGWRRLVRCAAGDAVGLAGLLTSTGWRATACHAAALGNAVVVVLDP